MCRPGRCSRVPLLAFHIQTVFGDDFAILGCGLEVVAHVPTKGLEKRVYERLADVGFLDSWGEEGLPVSGEVLTQLCNFIFALVECLTHKYSIFIPGYRQHSDAQRFTQRPSFLVPLNFWVGRQIPLHWFHLAAALIW